MKNLERSASWFKSVSFKFLPVFHVRARNFLKITKPQIKALRRYFERFMTKFVLTRSYPLYCPAYSTYWAVYSNDEVNE